MIALQLFVALVCGALLGAVHFYILWRSTRALVRGGSFSVTYVVSRMGSLFALLAVVAAALSYGVGFSNSVAALIGFFLTRLIVTQWAHPDRRINDAAAQSLDNRHAD